MIASQGRLGAPVPAEARRGGRMDKALHCVETIAVST